MLKKEKQKSQKKPAAPENKKVNDRLKKIDEILDGLRFDIEEGSPDKEAFKKTLHPLASQLTQPYDATKMSFYKKSMGALTDITKVFNDIKRDQLSNRSLRDFSDYDKTLLKKYAQDLFNDYKAKSFDAVLNPILSLGLNADDNTMINIPGQPPQPIAKELRYMFFGIDFDEINDPTFKTVKDFNKDKVNVLKLLQDAYKGLTKAFKSKK